jgi:hypothetical protein
MYSLYMFAKGIYGDDEEDELNLNYTASDFGKIISGNTFVDPAGGILQAMVFLARTWTGESTSAGGKVYDLSAGKFGQRSYTDVVGAFFRSKLAPVPSAVLNIKDGRNVIGEKATVKSELSGLVVPMIVSDGYDILRAHGAAKGIPLVIMAAHGVGVSIRDDEPSIKQRMAAMMGDNLADFKKKPKSTSSTPSLKIPNLNLDLKL